MRHVHQGWAAHVYHSAYAGVFNRSAASDLMLIESWLKHRGIPYTIIINTPPPAKVRLKMHSHCEQTVIFPQLVMGHIATTARELESCVYLQCLFTTHTPTASLKHRGRFICKSNNQHHEHPDGSYRRVTPGL